MSAGSPGRGAALKRDMNDCSYCSLSESDDESRTSIQPEPRKLLTDRPWREPSSWNSQLEKTLETTIQKLHPTQKPNILLVGPVGAGKSAFINAAISIGKGTRIERAEVGGGTKSYTTSYDKFTDDSPLMKHFRLRDCMGIEQGENEGFHVEDMIFLLRGNVKDTYQFNPRSPIDRSSNHFRQSPDFDHQTHCVVFVIDGAAIYNGLPTSYIRKIAKLQEKIKGLRIPRVVLLTHTDQLCTEVQRDIRNMFRSVKVRDAVNLTSEIFHIPPGSIHPVKNYHGEVQLDTMKNIPLLLALRQIMTYADDRCGSAVQSDSD